MDVATYVVQIIELQVQHAHKIMKYFIAKYQTCKTYGNKVAGLQ